MQSNNTQAALYMQRALEGSADSLEYAADLERLMRRIPDQHCEALQVEFGPKERLVRLKLAASKVLAIRGRLQGDYGIRTGTV